MEKKLALTDAGEVHAEIERQAREKAVAEVRMIGSIEVGKAVRQGDIYLHRVEDSHPRGPKSESRQLAVGTSMGSRHVAEAPAEVFAGIERSVRWCDPSAFYGPCIVAKERFTVSHPEHAHVSLPAGTYQVTHQMDARTRERVID